MRILIIGSLSGELGRAASMAAARRASIDQADDVRAAIGLLRRDASFNLVFCEMCHDITSLVRTLADERIVVPVVACGCDIEPSAAAAAMRAGARDFLPLPPSAELIAALLEAAAGTDQSVIARDPVMLSVIRRAEQVAVSNASVLIAGESGTGKEVLARHIHQKSRRSSGPFIAINCAAIPDNLLESELFGHEKGAFSGALGRRIGKFESASGGTLLLDEISEMDVRLQAKLLRALQEREIDRLGGSGPVKIDVRILATSNRDMSSEVKAGRFRADLFFRINVITIEVPPLRERKADIASLATFYAEHYARLNGVPARPLSPSAMTLLEAHDWPGNVRELENTVHRAVLLSVGPELEGDAVECPRPLPGDPADLPRRDEGSRSGDANVSPSISRLVGCSVEEVERALIIETLGHTAGNRTHAATILGISIRALRNKLRDYSNLGFDVPAPHAGIAL